jgi:hypothetical protein
MLFYGKALRLFGSERKGITVGWRNRTEVSVISGFRCSVKEIFALLVCYAA